MPSMRVMKSLEKAVTVAKRPTNRASSRGGWSSSSSRSFHATATSFSKSTALIIGSSGFLGSTLARYLSREMKMTVIGADVLELPNDTDFELDDFCPLPHYGQQQVSLGEITARLTKGVDFLRLDGGGGESQKLNVIVVASGGWQMDPTPPGEDATHLQVQDAARAYGESMETMMKMNYYPVAAAGYIAQEFMAPQGMYQNPIKMWCVWGSVCVLRAIVKMLQWTILI